MSAIWQSIWRGDIWESVWATPWGAAVAPGPAAPALLLETGDFLLLETGDFILLE